MNATSRAMPGPHATTTTVPRHAVVLRAEILDDARLAVEQDPVRLAIETAERESYRRVWRALMLANDLETGRALLGGEQVPLDRLDPEWVRRFGLRRAA